MAKKKLSHDQKRKQKKQKRAQSRPPGVDRFNPMIQRLKKAGMGDHKFIQNPPGQEKMSEVLGAFIQPYQHVATTTEAMHKLLATALVAWNAALLPEAERGESLQKITETLPDEAVEDFYAIVEEMIERKQEYFAQYDRMILDYELVDRGSDYHISVISTMTGE